MDKRAALPVGPPEVDPTISYWQDPPDAELADYQGGDALPTEVDTVIIGSGITGTSVAHGLLTSPSYNGEKILMLEARQACSGATGRNGGHTKAASYRSFLYNAEDYGIDMAAKIAKFEYNNIKELHAFARENGIECDLYSGDTVDIMYDQTQWDQGHEAIEAMQKAMPGDLESAARYIFWNKEEAREKFRVKGEDFIGAISYEAGSLSAYRFVIGMLKLCIKKNLQLFTHTPVSKLENRYDKWEVRTSRGVVTAKRVVLATNGYTASIWPQFQGSIVPCRGQVTAHRPGSNMPEDGLGYTYSFIYEGGYEYMIPRPQGSKFAGDIIIGGGMAVMKNDGEELFGIVDDTAIDQEISTYLKKTTPRYFGSQWGEDDKQGRVRKEWTGIMGFSGDELPFVGGVPETENLWVVASFQGHGMVLCWGCAKGLVDMINGEESILGGRFPDIFRVSRQRMDIPFGGRDHLSAKKNGDA
ncbi:FAD dependent oxidoreductase [Bisporella sp. PMI_857]|nr:FAD dependent oxidoreductase [Bisporella sp. PMI_857]